MVTLQGGFLLYRKDWGLRERRVAFDAFAESVIVGPVLPTFTDSFLVMNMFECKFDNKHFVIEKDGALGFYLYVYHLEEENPYADYLQDTLEDAKEFAFDEFQVPLDAWTLVSVNPF